MPMAVLLVHPLAQLEWFVALPPLARLCIGLVVTGPPIYAASYCVFRFVESPGIRFGNALAKQIGVRNAAISVPAVAQ
jgi:hypothetical protein